MMFVFRPEWPQTPYTVTTVSPHRGDSGVCVFHVHGCMSIQRGDLIFRDKRGRITRAFAAGFWKTAQEGHYATPA